MSIWYDGTNLNLYRGDAGRLIFKNLPCSLGYRVFFSVVSEITKEIVFECAGDPEYYYIDNEGEEYTKNPGETDAEFIERMEELCRKGDAMKRGRCTIFVSSDKTEKLWLLKQETQRKFYFGLKICFSSTGLENTLIPSTKLDEETGEVVFSDPPEVIVKPKYVEGLMPVCDYDDIDVVQQNPADYGIQPLVTPVYPLKFDKDYNLTIDTDALKLEMLPNVEINDLQDGDILVYSASKGKWINKHENEVIDGGDPDTTTFDVITNGGYPDTTSYNNTIDGEYP